MLKIHNFDKNLTKIGIFITFTDLPFKFTGKSVKVFLTGKTVKIW